MSQTIILEVRGRTAGLVVGADTSFRFFSSQPVFDGLDGRQFPSVVAAQRAANALVQRRAPQRRPLGRVA